MKKLLLTGLLTLAMGFAAHAVSFTYASTVNSFIQFNGSGGFHFTTGATPVQPGSFQVTSGSAGGLYGDITGNFQIGAINPGGTSAPVTGIGTFIIHDGANTFSATLVWNDISQSGTSNGLNTTGSANLSNITYGGSNTDLLALKAALTAANTLSFSFIPSITLSQMLTTTQGKAYSGTLASPDGGTTAALLGLALTGIAAARRSIKKA